MECGQIGKTVRRIFNERYANFPAYSFTEDMWC